MRYSSRIDQHGVDIHRHHEARILDLEIENRQSRELRKSSARDGGKQNQPAEITVSVYLIGRFHDRADLGICEQLPAGRGRDFLSFCAELDLGQNMGRQLSANFAAAAFSAARRSFSIRFFDDATKAAGSLARQSSIA